MARRASHKPDQLGVSGFTIVELMIATLVFSLVLLIVTSGIMQFSSVYYRGVTDTDTQNNARAITNEITQAIQFNGGVITTTPTSPGPTPGTPYAFCIGNQQYSYVIGPQLSTSLSLPYTSPNVLVVRNDVASCPSQPAQPLTGGGSVVGQELMLPSARLAQLNVTSEGNDLYKVEVRVVYGDYDVLCNESVAGDCTSHSPSFPTPNLNTYSDDQYMGCKDGSVSGTQFCAESDLTTTVVKRVQ